MIDASEHSDDNFAAMLAHYDEGLAGGRSPESHDDVSDPALQVRLQEAKECLEMLESAWPRSSSRSQEKIKRSPFGVIVPTHIGRFELRREIGRGGQGVVFEAFDPLLRRQVALKIPRPEVLVTEPMRQRFRREAEIAARLNHPNLIAVYEVGEDRPICYLVTAFCHGPTLSALLRQQSTPLPAKDAARLVLQLAGAVSYMHSQGVLHRDIKPGNILIDQASADESGPAHWVPRLTDFGLARFTKGATQHTRTGTILGTLSYMAPEQADGRVAAIGPHTDVYALGVVLYECLTGHPPFQDVNEASVLRRVLTDEPVAIKDLRQDVPGDLSTICMKCLEKLPQHRYASATALCDDLQRFLSCKSIVARPTGTLRRMRLWARREPGFAAALCLSVITLLLITFGVSYNALQTKQSNERYRLALERTEELNFLSTIQRAAQWLDSGDATEANLVMQRYQQRLAPKEVPDTWEWRYLWNRTQQSPRHYFWYGHQETPYSLAVSPDGKNFAAVDGKGYLVVRNIDSGKISNQVQLDNRSLGHLCYNDDGRYLAVVGVPKSGGTSDQIIIWNTEDWTQSEVNIGANEGVTSLCFHPEHHSLLVTLGEGVLDSNVGRLAEWKYLERLPVLKTLSSPGYCQKIIWSDGLKGMVMVTVKQVLLLDERYHCKPLTPGPGGQVTDAVISRNGRWLGWSNLSGRITLFDLDRSRARPSLSWSAHEGWLRKMAINPEGTLLASCGAGNVVQLWDTTTGQRLYHYQSNGQTEGVCFSNEGKSVLFGSAEDFAVHRWIFSQPSGERLCQLNEQVWSAALSPDNRSLLVGLDDDHSDQSIQYVDLTSENLISRKVLTGHHATVTGMVILNVPDRMVTSSIDGELFLWNTSNGQIIRQTRAPNNRDIRTLVATDRGVASAGYEGKIDLWDAELNLYFDSWHVHAGLSVPQLVFDHQNSQLLSAGCDGKVCAWDFSTHQLIQQFLAVGEARCVALSYHGKTLAYGTKQGNIYLADRETGKILHEIHAHPQSLCCLAFTPDDRSLISGDFAGELKAWQVSSGEQLFPLHRHQGRISSLMWNKEGTKLYSTSHDGRVLEHDFRR